MTTSEKIPKLTLNSGHVMPVVGLGTAESGAAPEKKRSAYVDAIAVGYRHFDTASLYNTEQPLGEAIQEAIQLGLIGSREELFITSKLWCPDNHPDLVLPSIQSSLRDYGFLKREGFCNSELGFSNGHRTDFSPMPGLSHPIRVKIRAKELLTRIRQLRWNLKMDYLDLYLIHLPMSVKPGAQEFPFKREDVVPLDLKGVWEAMEESQRLGLTKAIGVSNFNTKKLEELLAFAKIPPAVDQIEMNTSWQQQKLKEYCAKKGICITAYSPLGGQFGANTVLTCDVLKEIACAKGKTVAQIALRWLLEQGAIMVVKSFNKERLQQNLEIFDWELTEEERQKISKIPQKNNVSVEVLLTKEGSLNSIDISDLMIIEV